MNVYDEYRAAVAYRLLTDLAKSQKPVVKVDPCKPNLSKRRLR